MFFCNAKFLTNQSPHNPQKHRFFSKGFPVFFRGHKQKSNKALIFTSGVKHYHLRLGIIITGLFLSIVILNGSAQQRPYADSLQQLLQTAGSDTAKAGLLFLLSDHWADKDSSKALQYARQALALTKGYPYYEGLAHFYLAGAYFDINLARSQQEYLLADKLLALYTTQPAYWFRSRAWHNYGVQEQKKDNSRGFMNILLNKAIPLAILSGDSVKMAWNYMDVGMVLSNYNDYNKAFFYYNKALAPLRRIQPYSGELADCYMNMAKTSLLSNHIARAKPLLDSAFQILSLHPLSAYLPAYYQIAGMYFRHNGEWQKAIDTLHKGLALATQLHRNYDAFSIQYEQYEVYKLQHNFPLAKKVLLALYQQHNEQPLNHNKLRFLYELAATEAALGNMKAAYEWQQQYSVLADSLHAARTETDIAALEASYQFAQKEKEVLILNNRARIQQLLLWGGGILFIVTLLFFIYLFKQRKIKTVQQLKLLQQQQQNAVTHALLQGEERERRRLARDLHDGLGGMLAGVKINLSEVTFNTQATDNSTLLHKISGQLDNSVTELRRIARNMMPESLLRSGLEAALSDLCQSVTTDRLKVDLAMLNINAAIPKQVQLIIYRIIQELLANIMRHAGATEVFIQCSQYDELFYITVEDNGKGFEPALLTDQKGLGLANIRHRVDFLQGILEIDSAPGKGTVINIEINVAEKN